MENEQAVALDAQRLGEEWIRAVVEQDYLALADLCQPDVVSRLMTPRRYDTYATVSELVSKVEGWFSKCSSFQKEETRVEQIGEKLSITYRLSLIENGQPHLVEQHIYCALREGRIETLNLLCSGFQLLSPASAAPSAGFLKFESAPSAGSTCAVLTPLIKRKLVELSSGQILEVQVSDPEARADIEAWSRLSGNPLLKVEQDADQSLHFYLMKK